jgi:hypothetical protein
MDETKLAIDQGRGLRARPLMDDALLAEAFASLEADYVAAWKLTHRRAAMTGASGCGRRCRSSPR